MCACVRAHTPLSARANMCVRCVRACVRACTSMSLSPRSVIANMCVRAVRAVCGVCGGSVVCVGMHLGVTWSAGLVAVGAAIELIRPKPGKRARAQLATNARRKRGACSPWRAAQYAHGGKPRTAQQRNVERGTWQDAMCRVCDRHAIHDVLKRAQCTLRALVAHVSSRTHCMPRTTQHIPAQSTRGVCVCVNVCV